MYESVALEVKMMHERKVVFLVLCIVVFELPFGVIGEVQCIVTYHEPSLSRLLTLLVLASLY